MVDAKITVMVQKSYAIWNPQKIPVKSRIILLVPTGRIF